VKISASMLVSRYDDKFIHSIRSVARQQPDSFKVYVDAVKLGDDYESVCDTVSMYGGEPIRQSYDEALSHHMNVVHNVHRALLEADYRWVAWCVDENTEILTKNGWKKYNEIKIGEEVLTLNLSDPISKKLEYNKLKKINIFDYEGYMLRIKNTSLDMLLTPDHKMIYFRSDSYYKSGVSPFFTKKAEKFTHGQIPVAGFYEGTNYVYPELARIAGWVLSDGSFSRGRGKKVCGAIITQSKHNDKLEKALRDAKISTTKKLLHKKGEKYYWGSGNKEYNEYTDDLYGYYIRAKHMKKILELITPRKRLTQKMMEAQHDARIALFEGLWGGDGIKQTSTKESFKICTMNGYDFEEQIIELALKSGRHAYLNKKWGYVNVSIFNSRWVEPKYIKKQHYKGKVWCPTTENGTWVARRNGIPFITGNCDDDDELLSDRRRLIEQHGASDVGVIHGDTVAFQANKQPWLRRSRQVYQPSQCNYPSMGSGQIYNTDAFKEIHDKVDHGYWWDMKIIYWMMRAGYRCVYVPQLMSIQNVNTNPSEKRLRERRRGWRVTLDSLEQEKF